MKTIKIGKKITRSEALKLSISILKRAELKRMKFADDEASKGLQYKS
jgi:hypothetical protein